MPSKMRAVMARKPAKKADFPLLDHVEAQMVKLHEHAPAALERFDQDGIHQARVATRRLKAALDLMEPVLSKRYRKPVADALRRLRRRLGPLRDADVMIDHLCELVKENRHPAAAAWLRQRLEASRLELRKASAEKASADRELRRVDRWPNVKAEMAEAREAVDHLLAESLHLQTDAFAEQANRLVEDLEGGAGGGDTQESSPPQAEALAPEAFGNPTGGDDEGGSDESGGAAPNNGKPATAAPPRPRQNPHDLRIAGKALRYTLEMAEAEGHSPGSGVMKQFKRMQELLGAWHDYVVLADRAMQEVVAAELAHHDAPGAEQVIDLARFAVRRSATDLAGFAKLWRQQGEKLAAKIRVAFPLTQPAMVAAAAAAADEPAATPAEAVAADLAGVSGCGTGPGPDSTTVPAGPEAAPPGVPPAA